jgi:hypothetical protein
MRVRSSEETTFANVPTPVGDSTIAVAPRVDALVSREAVNDQITTLIFQFRGACGRRFFGPAIRKEGRSNTPGEVMNRLIYIVGLVVIVLAVLWFFGLR